MLWKSNRNNFFTEFLWFFRSWQEDFFVYTESASMIGWHNKMRIQKIEVADLFWMYREKDS